MSQCIESLNSLLYIQRDLDRHAAKMHLKVLTEYLGFPSHKLVMEEWTSLVISYPVWHRVMQLTDQPGTDCDWLSRPLVPEGRESEIGREASNRLTPLPSQQVNGVCSWWGCCRERIPRSEPNPTASAVTSDHCQTHRRRRNQLTSVMLMFCPDALNIFCWG